VIVQACPSLRSAFGNRVAVPARRISFLGAKNDLNIKPADPDKRTVLR